MRRVKNICFWLRPGMVPLHAHSMLCMHHLARSMISTPHISTHGLNSVSSLHGNQPALFPDELRLRF